MNKTIILNLNELNEESLKEHYGSSNCEKMVIVDDRAASDPERLETVLSVIPVGTSYAILTAAEAEARYVGSTGNALLVVVKDSDIRPLYRKPAVSASSLARA